MTVKSLPIIMMLLYGPVLWADVPAGQKPEVEYLLEFVRNSDCIMERNGSRHKGDEAVSHIQRKYDYFLDDIKSTEDFIEYSATKSTMSGKYYLVICNGQAPVRAKDWLLGALQEFREGSGK
jgi:hypothetical protein